MSVYNIKHKHHILMSAPDDLTEMSCCLLHISSVALHAAIQIHVIRDESLL